jgi:hypothetical protein
MGIVFLQLAVTALVGAAPAPALVAPAAGKLASTYDQATCATIHGAESDDWDGAAIGEDSPVPSVTEEECSLTVVVPARLADCNDPLASRWFGEMIGTCDMPRSNGAPRTGLRAAHPEGRRARLLIEIANGDSASPDGASPLAPPADPRSPTPALLPTLPVLAIPSRFVLLFATPAQPLASIAGDTLLRPPRA